MESGKDKDRRASAERRDARPREFEVAYFTKELGRPLQRKMLQDQLAALTEGAAAQDSGTKHGEDAAPEPTRSPPQADRAG